MARVRLKRKRYGVRVGGVLIRKRFASAAEARKWQRDQQELRDQIASGSKRHLSPTPLATHAIEWLKSRRDMASFDHQELYLGRYVLSRPGFHGKLLHEITKTQWKVLFGPYGELVVKHQLSPATHNRIRACVHRMYEDARREFEPPRAIENPIHDIPPLRESKKSYPILSDEKQIKRYVEAAYADTTRPCWGIYVAIKLNTGLRMQNIIPLRWRDWDESGGALHVREKYIRSSRFTGFRPGNKARGDERFVGVNDELKRALYDWRRVSPHGAPNDFIAATDGGAHMTVSMIEKCNLRTIKRAGLPYISEHKLRHSYATHYLAAGGNIHDLKENLFHSSVTTTEVYLHSLKSRLARRASVFRTSAPRLKARKKSA